MSLEARKNDRPVAIWLISVAAVIFCMILLGGATRLTHSGLSMVDWKPIMGIVPPLSTADWMATFKLYQQSPEYLKVNAGMSLSDFKAIFYFEYGHRLLGRLIGLLFLVPFLIFWFRGKIKKSLLPSMVLMFVFGGLQGVLGWYMVKSGLVNNPQVSQYRLTAHLMAAMLIYGYILWVAFGLLKKPVANIAASNKLFFVSLAFTLLIALMMASGGFVAGTKAGFTFNTFPLMGDHFIPEGMYSMQPFWLNWFENITTVQFNHRMFAYLLVLIVPVWAFVVRRLNVTDRSNTAAHLLMAVLITQVSLGVATILLQVPTVLGVIHQGGAVALFTVALFIAREVKIESS